MTHPIKGVATPIRKKNERPARKNRQHIGTHSINDEYNNTVVYLTFGELSLGANDAPDDGCSAEYLSTRAYKAVVLGGPAYVFDMGEHPGLNA